MECFVWYTVSGNRPKDIRRSVLERAFAWLQCSFCFRKKFFEKFLHFLHLCPILVVFTGCYGCRIGCRIGFPGVGQPQFLCKTIQRSDKKNKVPTFLVNTKYPRASRLGDTYIRIVVEIILQFLQQLQLREQPLQRVPQPQEPRLRVLQQRQPSWNDGYDVPSSRSLPCSHRSQRVR